MRTKHHLMLRRRQLGATLIVALMFLVVLSMLGIGMFFSTSSDEIAARNFRDREIALRAAEAAINEAKLRIHGMFDAANPPTGTAPLALSTDSCNTIIEGFSCDSAAYATSSVDLFSGSPLPGTSLGSYSTAISPTLADLPTQPRYLIVLTGIEECSQSAVSGSGGGSSRDCFKIFAQGRGRLGSSRVDLIEMYLR